MRTVTETPRRRFPVRLAYVFAVLGMCSGCGETQIPPEHRELILRLATATSSENPANLRIVEDEVNRLSAASEMTPEQTGAFMAIISLAKQGQWEAARDQAYALRDGQKPTAQDLEAVAARKLPEMVRPGKKSDRKNSG